ncbi:MAG TPA: peptidoglycan-binding protein [Gammaproteobacteria bacterium]
MLTDLQKLTIKAIVNIFETGRVKGDYGRVTLLQGDTGHLTYGRSQTTLASGNLYLLIKDYCSEEGADLAAELSGYLGRLEQRDLTLDHDYGFRALLKEAGDDPVMQEVQDAFFDRVYWEPCLKSAAYINAQIPLGVGIIYDSRIHGSWYLVRDKTIAGHGKLEDMGEKSWFTHYVETRRNWLLNHSNQLLRRTVYRMDNFQQIIQSDNWQLALPITVHGVRVDESMLVQHSTVRVSAEANEERLLMVKRPYLRGDNVKAIQQALANADIEVVVDGIFGPGTERAIIAFQKQQGLVVDGIVGPATRASLGF